MYGFERTLLEIARGTAKEATRQTIAAPNMTAIVFASFHSVRKAAFVR